MKSEQKPFPHRIRQFDPEIIFESEKGYVQLLNALAAVSGIGIDNTAETWFRQSDTDIDIRLTYQHNNDTHTIWTKRNGDYLNPQVLLLINIQLRLNDYTFQYERGDQTIFYINKAEKQHLETEGVNFYLLHPAPQFPFLLYNATMLLKTGEDFAYTLISLLNENAMAFYELMDEQQSIKYIQQLVRTLLEKADWNKIAELGIDTTQLYGFGEL